MEERIPTNLRTLLILEAIGRMQGPVTPAELGREIGLSKPTVHRLCATLLAEGFLARDDRKKGLRPGRRMRLLASGVTSASSAHIARHQVLMTLAGQVGETVNFVVPEDRGMTYQDRVETDWPFRIQLPVGDPCAVSLHRQRQDLSCQPAQVRTTPQWSTLCSWTARRSAP